MRMSSVRRISLAAVLGFVFIVLSLVFVTSVAYGWTFQRDGVACFEPTVTSVEEKAPVMMIMLDRSGSMRERSERCCVMGGLCGYYCGPSLWTLAVKAVSEVVRALTLDGGSDEVLFGLGFFPPVEIDVEADLARTNTYSVIAAALNRGYPNGFTPTGPAVDAMRESQTLQMLERPVAGVLITDGEPTGGITPREDAIKAACKMRADGKPLYVIGFSAMTDEQFNNKMAAAGGTGCCGPDASKGCPLGVGVDPCETRYVNASTCFGSLQANSGDEFKNALLGISQEVACTFALDSAGYPGIWLAEQAGAIRVIADGAVPGESIPYRSNEREEGWYFPNQQRDRVALSDEYCSRVQSGQITSVTTQFACMCEQVVGETCGSAGVEADCGQGAWACEEGNDRCEILSDEQCEDHCAGVMVGARCHVDNHPVNPNGDTDWLGEANRCKIGVIVCTENGPICSQLFQPMPELCNGLDDDCDGVKDNIVMSWNKSAFSGIRLMSGDVSACFVRDICVCPNGSGKHAGVGDASGQVTWEQELGAHLAGWQPVCNCAAALSP